MPNNDWNAFVNQYFSGVGPEQEAPSFSDPFSMASQLNRGNFNPIGMNAYRFNPNTNGMPGDGYNQGWAKLWASGLMDPYANGKGMFSAYNQNYADRQPFGDYMSGNQAASAIQNAFRDWQMAQQQQQTAPQAQTNTEPQAMQPEGPTAAQVLQAFAQSAPVTSPVPTGTYASLLAAMNTPQPQQATQPSPLASWIFQYLAG